MLLTRSRDFFAAPGLVAARGSSNVTWATAKLHREEPRRVKEFLPVVLPVANRPAGYLSAQAVANSYWAGANLREVAPQTASDLLSVLGGGVARLAPSMTEQAVANAFWAAVARTGGAMAYVWCSTTVVAFAHIVQRKMRPVQDIFPSCHELTPSGGYSGVRGRVTRQHRRRAHGHAPATISRG